MHYINKNWDKTYAADATELIKDLVSSLCYPILVNPTLTNIGQMESYRRRGLVDLPSTSQQESSKSKKAVAGYTNYLRVRTEYDDPDSAEDEVDTDAEGDTDHTVKTVEEEYNAWILDKKANADVDLLKFWEVSFKLLGHI